jgi:hypothetical protein
MRSLILCLISAGISTAISANAAAPLFDGKSLNGWVAEGPHSAFEVTGGELVVTGRGNQPNWLRTVAEYEDFRLSFEYKLAKWGEAAVVVRAPRAGRPAASGLALYLAHDYHNGAELRSTGAIAGARKPAKQLPASFEEWHSVELSVIGDAFHAIIDGVTVQDVKLSSDPAARTRLKRGFIGFPDYGYKYCLRGIKIEDLGGETPVTNLLAHGLEGWTLRGTGQWQYTDDGILKAWGGDGNLYAPGEFTDFELILLVRPHDRVNSGVFLRGSADLKLSRGFEIQIYSPIESVFPTGSIYNFVRSDITADFEDRWFLMQIQVVRTRCTVWLDGTLVAQSDRLPPTALPAGRIGLQFHSADGSIEFRDIMVRPIPSKL